MKLSTRARYGIYAMLDLAINYRGSPVAVKNISKRQKIPLRYLVYQLMMRTRVIMWIGEKPKIFH